MATLREVYDAAHPEGNVGRDLTFSIGGFSYILPGRCHSSFDTNTRFVSYFVSRAPDWRMAVRVLLNNAQAACEHADRAVELFMGNPTLGVPMRKSNDLRFAGRMYLYVETTFTDEDRSGLLAAGAERDLNIELRDLHWLQGYNASNRPLAFLSHDSRDKDEVARPLVRELDRLLCPVWYDEYSLRVGDSLVESIDRGIRNSPKCILLLSPSFLANPGWTKAEFTAIMNRHSREGLVILPVWHRVSREDVYAYSTFLVDIVALNTAPGIDFVAKDLAKALKPETGSH